MTLAGRLSEALLGYWIKTAWNDISQESILKGLKKCYVLCSMNRADACGRSWNKNFLLVMKVLVLADYVGGVFVTFCYS